MQHLQMSGKKLVSALLCKRYFSERPLPHSLRKREPVIYKGFKFHCSHKSRIHSAMMRWICSRTPTCSAQFTCDADGNSFTEIEPFHNHDPHELKKLSPHGDCPICQYTFKSSEEKEAHMNRTNHGTYRTYFSKSYRRINPNSTHYFSSPMRFSGLQVQVSR